MSIEEKSISYVLGALSVGERQSVDRERLYSPDLDKEILRIEKILASMKATPLSALPSEELWRRIVDATECERRELAGKTIENCSAGYWQIHGPGIEVKFLWSDKAMLIRCVPGAFEDAHAQPEDDDEHIIVLAGDLQIGGRSFGTGDYVCVPAATVHVPMFTSGGCILFTEYSPQPAHSH